MILSPLVDYCISVTTFYITAQVMKQYFTWGVGLKIIRRQANVRLNFLTDLEGETMLVKGL